MAAKPRDPQGPSPWAAPHSRWARALNTRDSSAWVALTRVGCVRIHGYNWLTLKEADDKMKNMPSAAHAEPQDDLPVAADPAACCLRMLVAGWSGDVKYHGGTGEQLIMDKLTLILFKWNDLVPRRRHKTTSSKRLSGICERLRCHLSSLWLEVIVVTLTLLSSLAITGELLVRFDILKVPSESCLDNQSLGSSDSESGARDVTTAETTSVSPGGAHGAHTMDIVRKVFHYISLAIAAVFLAEILLKMAAFRLKFFLNHWQVLDMLIVFATMVVEVAFDVEQTTPELEAATYIVIFRLWRLPHTCNIKAKAVQRSLEQEIEVWKAGKIKLDDKCNNLEMKNNKQKEKTDRLESELASLKEEMKAKHVSAHSNTTGAAPSSNAHIPLDMVDGLSSGRLLARHSLLPEDTSTHAQSQNKNKFSDREKLRAEEEDGKHNDRHEEDEDRADRRKGRYFRSGSESSLSCHAMEHEVHVQIEDRPEVRTESAGYTSSPESTRLFPLHTTPERGRGQPHDRAALVTGEQHERDVAYDNEGYRWDEADGDVEITGVLVHEIDGVKTYRSAEGIPMTSL